MADSSEDRKQADRIAKFGEWIEQWRKQGAGSEGAKATEEEKLQEIYWESRGVLHGFTVPGAAVLAAIERNIDVAGLPAVQQEMLKDIRRKLNAGLLDGPPSDKIDLVGAAVEQIVDTGLFEESVRVARDSKNQPWADISAEDKVFLLIQMAHDSGVWTDWWDDLDGMTPGAHVLATIEREVDYPKLAAWRRQGLETLRAQLDSGDLAGENPYPSGRIDRVRYALQLTELNAGIEDFKHIGEDDGDKGRYRRWGDMAEEARLNEIMHVVQALHLGTEPEAYQVIAREVDVSRLPEETRRELNDKRFDLVAANLRQQWQEDGYSDGVETWEDQSDLEKIGYLAGYAAKHGVSFERFVDAAALTLGLRSLDEFAADDVGHLLQQLRWAHGEYSTDRAVTAAASVPDARGDYDPPLLSDRQPVRESDAERYERQMEIIWSGAYFPEGWEAPHLTAPPASSVPGAVDRAQAQIEALKFAEFSSTTPPERRAWDQLPEWSKFNNLRHWVDWEGVSRADRAELIGGQVDAYEMAVLNIPVHEHHAAIDLPQLMEHAGELQAAERTRCRREQAGYAMELAAWKQARQGKEGSAPEAAPARGREYQVWHERGWPQSRINQMLGGWPASPFPQEYFHAADVQAGSLEEAVQLTTSSGSPLGGDHQPWDDNPGVRSYTPKPFVPRDTDAGDVIVDPQGQAQLYDGQGFQAIEAAPRQPVVTRIAQATGNQPGRAGKLAAEPPHPWPSEIARANRQRPAEPSQGRDKTQDKSNGNDNGHSM